MREHPETLVTGLDELLADLREASEDRARFTPSVHSGEPRHVPDLRGAVCAFVDAARREDIAIERVIIELKQIANRADPSSGYLPFGERLSTHDELISTSVTWCIEHYYRAHAKEL